MEKIKREERDPVECVAINEIDEQGQSQGHGNCGQHHHGRAPAQGEGNEGRH